jgi:hypothetical protein
VRFCFFRIKVKKHGGANNQAFAGIPGYFDEHKATSGERIIFAKFRLTNGRKSWVSVFMFSIRHN